MRRLALFVSALPVFTAAGARAQTPLDTAFTYQGELASGGTPAAGAYDVRFRIYDAATDGSQIGSMLCSDNLTIAAGRFTVSLDFGAAFAGEKRYLGLIAQEVREVLPDFVVGNEAQDTLTVNYSQMSVVAIGAVQELKARIDLLDRENADLKARLKRLEKTVEALNKGK